MLDEVGYFLSVLPGWWLAVASGLGGVALTIVEKRTGHAVSWLSFCRWSIVVFVPLALLSGLHRTYTDLREAQAREFASWQQWIQAQREVVGLRLQSVGANAGNAPSFAIIDDPGFVPLDPRTRSITGGALAEIHTILNNVGGRRAAGFASKIRIIDERFSRPVQESDGSAADTIAPGGRAVLRTRVHSMAKDEDPFFLVIVLTFRDSLTGTFLTQCFFRKFPGARNGVFFRVLGHATIKEADLMRANVPELQQACDGASR